MIENSQCKICRRQNLKLFLKGERCYSQKCAMVKRAYPPGIKGKRRKGNVSEYSRQMKEKQKLKVWYGLGEKQLKRLVRGILAKTRIKKSDPASFLVKELESRLDNVIFRLGFFSSRQTARQAVSHGYFLVNNRPVDVPSYLLKKGDEIKISPEKMKKKIFLNLDSALKRQKLPAWIQFDAGSLTAKILGSPVLEGGETLPVEIAAVLEFYSR